MSTTEKTYDVFEISNSLPERIEHRGTVTAPDADSAKYLAESEWDVSAQQKLTSRIEVSEVSGDED